MLKVERKKGKAEDIEGWLKEVRKSHPNGYKWLVLREFSGIQLFEIPMGHPADLPDPVVPGALIEGVAPVNSHGFPSVEITIWGRGSMQTVTVDPHAKVVVFEVEKVDV